MLFIGLLAPLGLPAQDTKGYRVEVLVLRHLDSAAEPGRATQLRDYSAALDLPERARTALEAGLAAGESQGSAGADGRGPPAPLLPGSAAGGQAGDPWADVTLLDARSPAMEDAWRRLRLSSEFRPEAFLSWEQPAHEPFPLLRIHNDEVALIDDPWADVRRYLRPARGSAAGPQGGPAQPEHQAFAYTLDSGQVALQELPDPALYYRVDGTVRLRRTRFLHFDVDLAYRAPLDPGWASGTTPPFRPGRAPLPASDPGGPTVYDAYRLTQSRQVKTDRMEYFDSPWLGVLVRVTEIDLTAEITGSE